MRQQVENEADSRGTAQRRRKGHAASLRYPRRCEAKVLQRRALLDEWRDLFGSGFSVRVAHLPRLRTAQEGGTVSIGSTRLAAAASFRGRSERELKAHGNRHRRPKLQNTDQEFFHHIMPQVEGERASSV